MAYTSGKQPNDLPVQVGGIGTSGLQEENKGPNSPFSVADNRSPNDGDNPSISSSVMAPSGKDSRNKSGGNISNPTPAMPGA